MSGWLTRYPVPDPSLDGVPIDTVKFPTRYFEYKWALDNLGAPGALLDAGAGFNPEIHVLPQLCAERGWHVTAVDANPAGLQMPSHAKIVRWVYDIRHLWRWQGADFDSWLCISTLEHIDNPEDQLRTLEAAYGVLRSGGTALLTADQTSPDRLDALLRFAGFDTDASWRDPQGALLTPRVSYAIGRKP